MKYYTLIGKEETNGDYKRIFGDYDKQTVLDAKLELNSVYRPFYKSMLIIKTIDKQKEINDAIDLLNTN